MTSDIPDAFLVYLTAPSLCFRIPMFMVGRGRVEKGENKVCVLIKISVESIVFWFAKLR